MVTLNANNVEDIFIFKNKSSKNFATFFILYTKFYFLIFRIYNSYFFILVFKNFLELIKLRDFINFYISNFYI